MITISFVKGVIVGIIIGLTGAGGGVLAVPRLQMTLPEVGPIGLMALGLAAAAILGLTRRAHRAGQSRAVSPRLGAKLVNTMLDAGIKTLANSNDCPVVRSDRGAHYRWPGWLSRLRDARLIRSMSRQGCSQNNAACEGFFGLLKTFYSQGWPATTVEQFIQLVDSHIHRHNTKRIKVSLGSLSPLEYRESFGIAA